MTPCNSVKPLRAILPLSLRSSRYREYQEISFLSHTTIIRTKMGFGGSVQAMIDSLRSNGRSRPSLRKSFHRQTPRHKLSDKKRINKIPSAADQQRIREKLVLYKTQRRKAAIKQIAVTILVMILIGIIATYVISLLQESPDYFFHSHGRSPF